MARSDKMKRSKPPKSPERPEPAGTSIALPYRVFLSHATYDKWIAKVLCDKIESIGSHVRAIRDDRDIAGGERIPVEIRTAIESSQEMAVLLTPESITRDWIKIEIGMAFMAGVRIVPLLYHIRGEQIPEIIREHRGFELSDLDQYLSEIEARARRTES